MRISPGAVVESWRALAAHAGECQECEVGVAMLRQVPDEPAPCWDLLCDRGRTLYERWDEVKRVPTDPFLIQAQETRARWGLGGLEEPDAQRRAGAIMQLPDADSARLFSLPDELREAQLRALVAGYRPSSPEHSAPNRRTASSQPHPTNLSEPEPTTRSSSTCATCGGPNPTRGRYCCRECRLAAPLQAGLDTPRSPSPSRPDDPRRAAPARPSASALPDTPYQPRPPDSPARSRLISTEVGE